MCKYYQSDISDKTIVNELQICFFIFFVYKFNILHIY
jgi:hypothetical protein